MGNKTTALKWLVFGLILPAYSLAQGTHSPLMGLPVNPSETTYSAYLPSIDRSPHLATDWESNRLLPGASNLFTNTARIHLDLEPVSNTQALQRIPFYLTAPYWLPRSRPFTNSNSDRYSNQPATHGALIDDIAILIRSASTE
jgi:hypothetical protein